MKNTSDKNIICFMLFLCFILLLLGLYVYVNSMLSFKKIIYINFLYIKGTEKMENEKPEQYQNIYICIFLLPNIDIETYKFYPNIFNVQMKNRMFRMLVVC